MAREQWGQILLSFNAGDDRGKLVAGVDLYTGDNILDAIERAGMLLMNKLAKDTAARMSDPASIVDSTVERLNGVASLGG